ncbi:MAG: alanine/glycine:cation symporter family protein [Bacteroidales bacterium]|nr:alanine/glycine:cation symporter family protein [Bacteroidales bacterium]
MQKTIADFLNNINAPMATVMVLVLSAAGLWFTIKTKGVQFTMIGEMFRLLFKADKGKLNTEEKRVSAFEAFMVSLASRVGTGNLAGVATAIVIGGPGAIFWMWVMALIGSVNTFVECTLAQLFKSKAKDSFIGGPAFYITKGLKKRWLAVIFAVAILAQFGLTNNMVQANTISSAFTEAFSIPPMVMAFALSALALAVVFGGIQRIAKVCSYIVPFMALTYLGIAVWVLAVNITVLPEVLGLIVRSAFGFEQAAGGMVGTAILMGFKRGIFSNEAGEGSAPNAAATADVSHPVKQGLIQTLGVFTDTLVVCTCTALIIMCSGLYNCGANGIELTQVAMTYHIGPAGKYIVAVCILFFAFSSVIGNYYYGECNLTFLCNGSEYTKAAIQIYRLLLGILIFLGSLMTIEVVWALVDFFMVIMTVVNLTSIFLLGKYAIRLLDDYKAQLRQGKDPEYHSSTMPEISDVTECWKD